MMRSIELMVAFLSKDTGMVAIKEKDEKFKFQRKIRDPMIVDMSHKKFLLVIILIKIN